MSIFHTQGGDFHTQNEDVAYSEGDDVPGYKQLFRTLKSRLARRIREDLGDQGKLCFLRFSENVLMDVNITNVYNDNTNNIFFVIFCEICASIYFKKK